MFPRWLPLYLLGIAALTLFPFLPPDCARLGWVLRASSTDFIANVLAFVPIGLALHRSPVLRAVAFGFALSLAIETAQGFLPRLQDAADLMSNTLGALVGHRIAVAWRRRWDGPLFRPVTRRAAVFLVAPVLLIGALAEAFVAPASDFSNWTTFPLVIGNSPQGDRPWIGELSEVMVFDRSLGAGEATPSEEDPVVPALWAEGGPILWLHFEEEEPTGRIDGPSGPVRYSPEVTSATAVTASGLRLLPSGVFLEDWVSDHVVERLRGTGELSVDVRMRSGAEVQHGPARLVSMGNGRHLRNFMLAQRGSRLIGRIRTPANGIGATRSEMETQPGSVTGDPQHVRLTYDGYRGAIHIDGVCHDSSHMALSTALPMMGPFLGVTIVLCTALPALAAASFTRRPRRRLLLALLGGGATWCLLLASGIWGYLGGYTGIAATLGGLALLATVPLLRPSR